MNTLTRLAVGAVTALVAVAPISAASSANAATRHIPAKHWTVIETGLKSHKAKQEACKVLVNHRRAWKIYNRLDSSKATGSLTAYMVVTQNGNETNSVWTSGVVKKGHISAVGTVLLPRKGGYGLQASWNTGQSGGGGVVSIAKIGLC